MGGQRSAARGPEQGCRFQFCGVRLASADEAEEGKGAHFAQVHGTSNGWLVPINAAEREQDLCLELGPGRRLSS